MSKDREKLDQNGRCCGRKPLHYKGGSWRSPDRPMLFCTRCCREFDPNTGIQVENWAYKNVDGTLCDVRTKGGEA